jgi:hypothetical protein
MVWEYIRTEHDRMQNMTEMSVERCDSSPQQKITATLLNTTANTTAHHVQQHHPPMPPTKAMGAITQNRRGHPTATP